jgi:L-asparaginase II
MTSNGPDPDKSLDASVGACAGAGGTLPRNAAPPVLVEVRRGNVVESRHRGHIVQVDEAGRIERGIGDPHLLVNLRSSVKPFALIALVESGAVDAFKLSDPELAVMAASHTGEDAHVRTLQAIFRRLEPVAVIARVWHGERTAGPDHRRPPGPRWGGAQSDPPHVLRLPHRQPAAIAPPWLVARRLLAPGPPSQVAVREVVSGVFGVALNALRTSVDSCGVYTYAFPLADIARAFGLLAEPDGIYAASLTRIRDAMMAAPEMVGGSRDSSDTQLMKARRGLIVLKGGAEALRGVGILRGARGGGSAPFGVAIKIEDGDPKCASQQGSDGRGAGAAGRVGWRRPRAAGRHASPAAYDPRGTEVGQSVASFELAPLSELA